METQQLIKKSKGFIEEFKEFAMRGNVIDLAIGVIIGGAFGKITTSLVADIINPLLGLIIGKINFSNLFFTLSLNQYDTLEKAKEAGVPIVTYGTFLNSVLDFIIMAFVIFIVVKQINKLRAHHEASGTTPSPTSKKCPFCFSEISIKATRCPNCTSELPVA